MKNHQQKLSAAIAGRKQTLVQDRARSLQSRLRVLKTSDSLPVFRSYHFTPPATHKNQDGFVWIIFQQQSFPWLYFCKLCSLLCNKLLLTQNKTVYPPHTETFLTNKQEKTPSLQIYRKNMGSLTKGEKRAQLTFKLMQYLKTWLSCIRQIKKYTLNFKAEDVLTSSDMYVKVL